MSTELTTTQPSAVALIQQAITSGADPAYLRELLAVRREWEADEARKAYCVAVSEFQRKAPIIEKGDDAHGKSYARLDRIWRTIRPLVAELGLSVTWQKCELRDGICHVEGTLAHAMGHSTPIVADTALPELIRGQNAAQQVGSAETYAKRRALCSALGIVTGDDDDGHAAATVVIEPAQVTEILTALGELDEFDRNDALAAALEWAGVERVEELPASKFKGVLKGIKARKK